MLTKILLIVAMIAALVAATRISRGAPAKENVQPASRLARNAPRLVAYGIAAAIMITTGLIYYVGYREETKIMTIRVVNTATGESTLYEAYQGNISERRFETVDGRVVTVADIERVEVLGSR